MLMSLMNGFYSFWNLLLVQAIFNMGCGPNGCNVNYDKINNYERYFSRYYRF